MAKSVAADLKRIGIFGNFGTGNFGNDGSLESMLLTLRRIVPDAPLCCICSNPAFVAATYGLVTLPYYPVRQDLATSRLSALVRGVLNKAALPFHVIRHLRKLRAIIVPGTGILDDFAIGPFGWPYNLFCWFVLARVMKVPVLLVSIGAGPIHHPLSRWLLTSAARAARYRSYRDDTSKSFMAGIGFDVSSDPIFPDLAFSLPTLPDRARDGHRITVGVGLMTYYGWSKNAAGDLTVYHTYVAKMAAYIKWLLAEGHRIRLLIGDESDDRAVQDVMAALRGHGAADEAVAFAPVHTLGDVMRQMADIDVAVATRFHNVVCALKMGKPTISISYAAKNDVLLAEMGLAQFCQHIERFDIERLKEQTGRLLSDRAALAERIRAVCSGFEAALDTQEKRVAGLLIGNAPL